jgi:hypothetical protein
MHGGIPALRAARRKALGREPTSKCVKWRTALMLKLRRDRRPQAPRG